MAQIYEFGDLVVKYRSEISTRFDPAECKHTKLTYSEQGHIITCDTCSKQIDAWWAFMHVVRQFSDMHQRLNSREQQVKEMESKNLTHKAALMVEKSWRKRDMTPTCPHCHGAISPADGFGRSMVNKTLTRAGHEARPMLLLQMPVLVTEPQGKAEV